MRRRVSELPYVLLVLACMATSVAKIQRRFVTSSTDTPVKRLRLWRARLNDKPERASPSDHFAGVSLFDNGKTV